VSRPALACLTLAGLALFTACSREEWVLDAEVPLLRDRTACGFGPDRDLRDAVQLLLEPGQEFAVRRRLWVEGQPCWFIRTADGHDGWIVFAVGRAHRIR